jgi:hypothetical protein
MPSSAFPGPSLAPSSPLRPLLTGACHPQLPTALLTDVALVSCPRPLRRPPVLPLRFACSVGLPFSLFFFFFLLFSSFFFFFFFFFFIFVVVVVVFFAFLFFIFFAAHLFSLCYFPYL